MSLSTSVRSAILIMALVLFVACSTDSNSVDPSLSPDATLTVTPPDNISTGDLSTDFADESPDGQPPADDQRQVDDQPTADDQPPVDEQPSTTDSIATNEVPSRAALREMGLTDEQIACFVETVDPDANGLAESAELFVVALGTCDIT